MSTCAMTRRSTALNATRATGWATGAPPSARRLARSACDRALPVRRAQASHHRLRAELAAHALYGQRALPRGHDMQEPAAVAQSHVDRMAEAGGMGPPADGQPR